MLPLHWLLLNSSRIHVRKMSALIFPCVVSSCENFRSQRLMCKSIIVHNLQINFWNEKKKKRNKRTPNQQCQEIILWSSDSAVGAELAVLVPLFLALLEGASQGCEHIGSVKPHRLGLVCTRGKGLNDCRDNWGVPAQWSFSRWEVLARTVQLMLAFLSLSVLLWVYLTCLP